MHRAPYSVVKIGDKWAILVCGASVICCERRATAVRIARQARELLDAFETARVGGGGKPCGSPPPAHSDPR